MKAPSRSSTSAEENNGWVPGGTTLGGDYVAWDDRPVVVNDAIEVIRTACDPKRIIIYGPAAKGYVEGNHVDVLVIIGEGDIDSTRRNLTKVLALDDIDGNVTVVDKSMFRRNIRLSYTSTYDAIRTGYEA